jgi:hypothetical protein
VDRAAKQARWVRRWQRLAAVGAFVGIVALVVFVWLVVVSARTPIFVSDAQVTASQKQAIASYLMRYENFFRDHHTRAGCPVKVLGASAAKGPVVIAYAVVHCFTAGPKCGTLTDETDGIVARLRGNRVLSARVDDAIDYQSGLAEEKIFPAGLRSQAFSDMDGDGPPGYDALAMRIAGCGSHA